MCAWDYLSLENASCLISVSWIVDDEANFFMRRQIGGENGERGESGNNEIGFRMAQIELFLNHHGHMYEPEKTGS